MSHRNRGGYRNNSQKNLILGITIIILAVLLSVLLWTNKVSENKKMLNFRNLTRSFFKKTKKKKKY